MIGRTVSHYRILEELGRGGMGVVYRAEDLKLKRVVALKFLPPELTGDGDARRRFVQEARAASALEHTNVCNIHDIDESDDGSLFIVMACYEGETLRDRIKRGTVPVDEALGIAIQVAGGLARAHEAGIVHRDIKPGNLFITAEGDVKILDFGLARLSSETRFTKSGSTLGTAAYMSPEQAEGKGDVDARADVWSLGVVLYEMLAGRPPFRGDAEPAIVHSILEDTPDLLTAQREDVPSGVEYVVERALEKNPAKRYANASDMRAALHGQRELVKSGIVTRRSVRWKKFRRNRRAMTGLTVMSVIAIAVIAWALLVPRQKFERIAVLPVEIIGGKTADDTIFVDGMTVELIGTLGQTLGQTGSMSVSSWQAVQRYRGTDMTLAEIAGELGADAILLATVIRDEGQVRLTTQLVDSGNEHQVWASTFDRRISGILSLYRDLSRSVAEEIHATITTEVDVFLGSARPVDPAAYDAVLVGDHLLRNWHADRAQEQYDKALAIDSTYAPAWSGLADTYLERCHTWPIPEGFIDKSRKFATRSIELDPSNAEGYFVLAHIAWHHDWDMDTARRMVDRGLELNPSSYYGHLVNVWYCQVIQDYDEAIESARKLAEDIAPFHYLSHTSIFWSLLRSGRTDEALAAIERAGEVLEDFEDTRKDWLRRYYVHVGDYEAWFREFEKMELGDSYADRRQSAISLASVYSMMGDMDKSARYYREWLSLVDTTAVSPDSAAVAPLNVAFALADLGQIDDAFRWMDKAYEQRSLDLVFLRHNVEFPGAPILSIVNDPRYHELLRKLGLED